MSHLQLSLRILFSMAAPFLLTSAWADEAVVLAEQPVNNGYFTVSEPVVLRVNLTTGTRSVISAVTSNDQLTPLGQSSLRDRGWQSLTGVAIEASGQLIVAANSNRYNPVLGGGIPIGGALYRVNPATGDRKLLSNFSDAAQGILGCCSTSLAAVGELNDVVIDKSGHIYVSDSGARKLFSVDAATGNRTVVSDANQSVQGADGFFGNLAVLSSGVVLVEGSLAPDANTLFSVDPTSGSRSLFSLFTNTNEGPTSYEKGVAFTINDSSLHNKANLIAVDSNGGVLTIFGGGTDNHGALYQVAGNGFRTLISDFGNSQQGRFIDNPVALKVTATGQVLVLDNGYPNTSGALVAVDPTNGNRTVISDFSNPSQGPGTRVAAMDVGNATVSGGTGSSNATKPTLTLSSSSSTVAVKNLFTYTVTFNNNSVNNVSKVKFTDVLPSKTKIISLTPSTGCKLKQTLTCNFGTINAGSSVTLDITVLAKKKGKISNKAVVTYLAPKNASSTKLKAYSINATAKTTIGL